MRRLLIILALLPLTAFCQNAEKESRISLGLTFSPDYCYRTIKSNSVATVSQIAEWRDSTEIAKFGYTTGFNFAYKINNRISLQAGVLFSDKGEKTRNLALNTSHISGQFIFNSVDFSKIELTYSYYYIDIPVRVNFYILSKKAKLYAIAGLSPNIYINGRTKAVAEFEDGPTQTNVDYGKSGFTTINLAVVAGLGFSYDLTNNFYLSCEPTYRRSVTSIIDANIKGYLYSMGLNTGIYYKL